MADSLRIVGVCASPRRGANTSILLDASLDATAEAIEFMGFEPTIEKVELAGKKVSPCLGCDQCAQQRRPCILQDDWHELVRPLVDPVPDGVIFGSPVYFFNQNALGRAYMERCTSLIKGIWDPETSIPLPDWSTTAAGGVAVGYDRHGGVEFTLNSVLQWFLVMGFATVGGFYLGGAAWTGFNPERDAVRHDDHGLGAAQLLGRRVARMAALLKKGKTALGERAVMDVTWRSLGTPLVKGGDE